MLRVTLCSIALASVASMFITLFIYLTQDNILSLDAKIINALFQIFWFWLRWIYVKTT